jgi:asparagine N-glycosylation enzyme membrane subunit Stt3
MSTMLRFLAILTTLMVSQLLFAQNNNDPNAAAGGCLACGGCGFFVVLAVVGIGIAIFLAIWVSRDAKARGMDNVALWVILVIFLGLIGLVIDLLARPKGNLIQCPSCQGKRLQGGPKCPQCGNA